MSAHVCTDLAKWLESGERYRVMSQANELKGLLRVSWAPTLTVIPPLDGYARTRPELRRRGRERKPPAGLS